MCYRNRAAERAAADFARAAGYGFYNPYAFPWANPALLSPLAASLPLQAAAAEQAANTAAAKDKATSACSTGLSDGEGERESEREKKIILYIYNRIISEYDRHLDRSTDTLWMDNVRKEQWTEKIE